MFSNSQFFQTTWKAAEGKANVSLIKCNYENLLFQRLNRLLTYDSEVFWPWFDRTIIYTTVMKKWFWSASLLRNTEALVTFSDGPMKPVFFLFYSICIRMFCLQQWCYDCNADVLVRMVNWLAKADQKLPDLSLSSWVRMVIVLLEQKRPPPLFIPNSQPQTWPRFALD